MSQFNSYCLIIFLFCFPSFHDVVAARNISPILWSPSHVIPINNTIHLALHIEILNPCAEYGSHIPGTDKVRNYWVELCTRRFSKAVGPLKEYCAVEPVRSKRFLLTGIALGVIGVLGGYWALTELHESHQTAERMNALRKQLADSKSEYFADRKRLEKFKQTVIKDLQFLKLDQQSDFHEMSFAFQQLFSDYRRGNVKNLDILSQNLTSTICHHDGVYCDTSYWKTTGCSFSKSETSSSFYLKLGLVLPKHLPNYEIIEANPFTIYSFPNESHYCRHMYSGEKAAVIWHAGECFQAIDLRKSDKYWRLPLGFMPNCPKEDSDYNSMFHKVRCHKGRPNCLQIKREGDNFLFYCNCNQANYTIDSEKPIKCSQEIVRILKNQTLRIDGQSVIYEEYLELDVKSVDHRSSKMVNTEMFDTSFDKIPDFINDSTPAMFTPNVIALTTAGVIVPFILIFLTYILYRNFKRRNSVRKSRSTEDGA